MARKIGVYGPRVIGKDQFEKEQKTIRSKANIYGPRVLRKHPAKAELEKAVEAQKAAEEEVRHGEASTIDEARKKVMQARKNVAKARGEMAKALDEGTPPTTANEIPTPADPTNETPPEHPTADGSVMNTDQVPDTVQNLDWDSMNLDQLEEALEAFPSAVLPALAAEEARKDPRKGAFRAILAAEYKRSNGPREDVVNRIEAAL